jgi:hypothetical protein
MSSRRETAGGRLHNDLSIAAHQALTDSWSEAAGIFIRYLSINCRQPIP